jgi:hypothetical protein
MEWLRHAATWSDMLLRRTNEAIAAFRAAGRF